MTAVLLGLIAILAVACAYLLGRARRRRPPVPQPAPTYSYDAPDSIEYLSQAGMLNGPVGMADPELSMILVVTTDPDDPDQAVMCGVVSAVHEAGRLVGILQAQADAGGFRVALNAAAEQGHMWALEQLSERAGGTP